MNIEDLNNGEFSEEQQQNMLFMMLIQQHQQIAMMGLGKIKNPSTDETQRDLKAAKFAIDTLHMLQKYTQGNLSDELENYLEQTLSTLRLNYADEQGNEGEEQNED